MRDLTKLDTEELLVAYTEATLALASLDWFGGADEDELEAAEYVVDELKAAIQGRMA